MALPERVKIKSAENGKFLTAPDGISDNSLIYCTADEAGALVFEPQGPKDKMSFRVQQEQLFLSFRNASGAVKLYSSASDAFYKLEPQGNVWNLYDLAFEQYMWLDGDEPYVTSGADPTSTEAQWIFVSA